MILYHGTNIDFKDIDFDKCVPFKDFGKGFYLTDIREQAEALAQEVQIVWRLSYSPGIYLHSGRCRERWTEDAPF